MARITLSGVEATTMLHRVVADMAKQSPISQNEKKWARWLFVIEHFGRQEVTFELDEIATILMRSKD